MKSAILLIALAALANIVFAQFPTTFSCVIGANTEHECLVPALEEAGSPCGVSFGTPTDCDAEGKHCTTCSVMRESNSDNFNAGVNSLSQWCIDAHSGTQYESASGSISNKCLIL